MKFLIIRFSSIGDIVLTSPVARHLKQNVKDAEVHYTSKSRFKSVLQHNPNIDKCIYLEDDYPAFIKALKAENYDYVIDLHRNLRSRRIKMALGKPSRSYGKLNFQKWLHVNFKLGKLPNIHIVDRYMNTIAEFVAQNDGKGLDYYVEQEDEKVLDKLTKYFRNEGFVSLVIGAMHFTKQIPIQRVIEMCEGIKLPIILLGGPDEKSKAEEIIKTSKNPNVHSMAGECSLNESAVVIKHSKAVITSDTGLMHIAAAFHKPIFSLWGSTIPEYGMYPYLPNEENKQHIYEVKNLSCRSCSKIGHQKCPKKHFDCMEKIDYQRLIQEINKI